MGDSLVEFLYKFRSESGTDQRELFPFGKKHLENCLSLRLVPKLGGGGCGVVNSCTHSGKKTSVYLLIYQTNSSLAVIHWRHCVVVLGQDTFILA